MQYMAIDSKVSLSGRDRDGLDLRAAPESLAGLPSGGRGSGAMSNANRYRARDFFCGCVVVETNGTGCGIFGAYGNNLQSPQCA